MFPSAQTPLKLQLFKQTGEVLTLQSKVEFHAKSHLQTPVNVLQTPLEQLFGHNLENYSTYESLEFLGVNITLSFYE